MDDTLFTQPNVARYLLRAISDEGVEHAFAVVTGYKIAPFLSQFDEAKVTPIVACHEAGAVYMADGYARATKNFGVAMGIGGPRRHEHGHRRCRGAFRSFAGVDPGRLHPFHLGRSRRVPGLR